MRACYVDGHVDEVVKQEVYDGKYQIVYFTPEMLLGSKKWRRVFLTTVYTSRLRAFVVDEAHTVIKW